MYGTGTRSYNRSTEKREMDRQRKAATLAWENSPRVVRRITVACRCLDHNYPHIHSDEEKMVFDFDRRSRYVCTRMPAVRKPNINRRPQKTRGRSGKRVLPRVSGKNKTR